MATKTFEELKQLAIQIRDEKTNKANTATRIGTQMIEHLNKLEQEYYNIQTVDGLVSEYNVSVNHPTSGIDGSNKYTLSSAIALVPEKYRSIGIKCSFVNEDGNSEHWEYQGKSWDISNFSNVGAKKFSEIEEKIFNTKWMQGGILANGQYSLLNNAYEVTDFIPVYPGLKVTVDVKLTRSDLFNTGYDENKKYVTTLAKNGEISIPEKVYYIRINNEKVYYPNKSVSLEKTAFVSEADVKGIIVRTEGLEGTNMLNNRDIYWLNIKDIIPVNVKFNKVLSVVDGSTNETSAQCFYIEYIDISQIKTLMLNGVCCANNKEVALACFYRQDKSFISAIKYLEFNKVLNNIFIEKPSDAKYVQIGYNVYNISGFTKVDILTSVNNYVNETLINKEINKYFKDNNLLNYDLSSCYEKTGSANGYLTEDGTTNYGGCYTTDYLALKGQKILYLKNVVCATNVSTLLACFYDSEKRVIRGSGIEYSEKGKIIEAIIKVPVNAAYARFSRNTYNIGGYKGNIEPFGCIDSTEVYTEINKVGKPFYGQKILSLGDSYTWLNFYGKYLAEITGCTQRGRGQNGNFLKSFANDTYTSSDGGEATELFDETLLNQYDIVTIMGGTNDYGHGPTTLGSLETMEEDGKLGVNSKTIYGAVWYLINKILTIKPNMKIFFCTQPFRLPYELNASGPGGYEPNSNGLTMEKIAEAIKDAAGHFGIPVFDFYHCSNWNPWTVRFLNPKSPKQGEVVDNIYTYDGLHPKDGKGNGADLLGTAFGMFINSH